MAEERQNLNDKRISVGEQAHHGAHDHHRNEVGHVGNRLHRLAEAVVFDLVNQKCEENRKGKRKNQRGKADDQRVFHQTQEIIGSEKFGEIAHADPFTAPNALAG